MPFCPKCKYEYVEGIEKCPDCDAELVWELPDHKLPFELPAESARHQDLLRDEEIVTVFTAKDSIEEEIVRGILESAGIHCYATPEVTRWARGASMLGGLNSLDIMVLESQASEAQAVIKEAMEAGSDLPEEM